MRDIIGRVVDPKLRVQSLFDELSPTYDTAAIDFFGQIARALVRHARLREGSVVLDLGCGAGAALIAAADAVGPRGSVIGIDLSAGMVERARRVVDRLALENVRVEVGDAEAPPASPGSIDAIVASLVLFFLPNIGLALDRYSRALATGGTLAFSTLAGDDDWAPLDLILEHFMPEPPPADEGAWFATAAGITSLLGAHGFGDISIEEVTHRVDFPTTASFHEWSWSTGYRATWAAVAPTQRESARAAVDEYLDSLCERRGGLRFATAVRYTRATAT